MKLWIVSPNNKHQFFDEDRHRVHNIGEVSGTPSLVKQFNFTQCSIISFGCTMSDVYVGCSNQFDVYRFDNVNGGLIRTFGHNSAIIDSFYVDDVVGLITIGNDPYVRRWGVNSGVKPWVGCCFRDWPTHVNMMPNGRVLAGGSIDVVVWEFVSANGVWWVDWDKVTSAFPTYMYMIGNDVFIGTNAGYIHQFNTDSNDQLRMLTGHADAITSIQFDGYQLFSSSMDNWIRVWDLGLGLAPSQSTSSSAFAANTLIFNVPTNSMVAPTSSASSSNIANSIFGSATTSDATILIIIGSVFLLLVFNVGLIVFVLRRTSASRQRKQTDLTGNDTTMNATQNSLTTTVSNGPSKTITSDGCTTFADTFSATLVSAASTGVVSIPGFLLLTYLVDCVPGDVVLAKGSFGKIMTCTVLDDGLRQRSEGKALVIKKFDKDVDSMTEATKNSFFQELSLMWRMNNHPYFCKVFGYSTEPGVMVLQYYQMGDCHKYIEKKNVSVSQKFPYTKCQYVSLFHKMLEAFSFMHKSGFAHCDIKPANILLDIGEEGELIPIVTDFGISRILDVANVVKEFQMANVVGASLVYAAPEVLVRLRKKLTQPIDGRVCKAGDVYALAVVLLQMMSRRKPWC